MLLKEAFRYSNHISGLLTNVVSILTFEDNITNVKLKHLISKVNPDAEDKDEDKKRNLPLDCDPNNLVDLLLYLFNESESLTKAITKAKQMADMDMDSSISLNKKRQLIAQVFSRMAGIKASERTTTGVAKKFNAEGNQISYQYEVTEIKTIDFDRNKVKALSSKLLKEADAISLSLNKMEVEVEVDYTPVFDLNDSLEDVIQIFKKKQ